ncbi:hypothetical protein LINPERHAP1_LOCUS18518 [Linum perenne]
MTASTMLFTAVFALDFISFLLALAAEQTRTTSFLGAEACLVAGTVKNAHRNKYRGLYGFGDLDCETLGAGVFEAGAVLIMICSFASKMNHCWSDTDEELQTCDGRCSELGAYSPL